MTAPAADTGNCERCNRANCVRFPDPTTDERICLDCCAVSATQITDTIGRFLCPRRIEMPSTFRLDPADTWRRRPGDAELTCSHCGSLHPLAFMRAAANDVELGPTDKSYKVYVGAQGKFYFQHLSIDDRLVFIELLNAKVPHIGDPGYFYTRPFFIAP